MNDDDLVIERDGAVVLIDEMSLQFLQGARIDYAEDLMAAAFKIENPNASSACGCGNSFRTDGEEAPEHAHSAGCNC